MIFMVWETEFKNNKGRYATWEEIFEMFEGDGILFTSLNFNPTTFIGQIYVDYTKDNFPFSNPVVPRAQWHLYKNEDGIRKIIDVNEEWDKIKEVIL